MKRMKRFALAAAGLGVATALVSGGLASADPTSNGNTRLLQGMGSDTTEEVMNGLSEVVTIGGDKVISSWNAQGSALQTRASGCNYNATGGSAPLRANGSGNGVNALKASLNPADPTAGCLDFARASSGTAGTASSGATNVTMIPFAKDAVGFAVTATSNLPRKLTYANLKAMYNCTYPGFTGANPTYHALIPQSGSGTRSFWLGAMGLTDDTNATTGIKNGNFACISDETDRSGLGTVGATFIQEHQGNVLDNNTIVPISIAQYIAQSQGAATDYRGSSVLGTVIDNGSGSAQSVSYPMQLNTTYGTVSGTSTLNAPLTRDVYNAIPTARVGDTANYSELNQVFVGSGSLICQQGTVIKKYGFGTISNCGDTVLTR
jgi:hypothetical protein